MAVGLQQDNARCPLNLTQLRRNKCKKADKTCGRKRPRADDVDVVPAGDADPDVAERLTSTISNSMPEEDDVEPDHAAPATTQPDTDNDNCHSCKAAVPPPKKG